MTGFVSLFLYFSLLYFVHIEILITLFVTLFYVEFYKEF